MARIRRGNRDRARVALAVAAVAWTAVASASGCAATPEAHALPDECTFGAIPVETSGLQPLAYAYVAAGEALLGHSRELVVDGDLLFVADSNGLPILRQAPPGSLDVLHEVNPEPEKREHCSSLALHAASRTLLCTAADDRRIRLLDVSDPSTPVGRWRPEVEGDAALLGSIPDVAISGETAYFAAQNAGVLRAILGPDGTPGPLEATGIGAATVQVEVAGDRLLLLDRKEGLLVVDATSLQRLGSAAVEGPPLDLAVDGDRVAISRGSEGVVGFLIDGQGDPDRLFEVQPRCAATASDLDAELLAVACLSGVTLYELSGGAPRVAGFVPSRYGMLDLAFTAYGLVVVDWFRVDLFAVDPAGRATLADAPRAMRLAPGAGARVPIRNPGEEPLELGWALRQGEAPPVACGQLSLAPQAETLLELSGAEIAAGEEGEGPDLVLFQGPLPPRPAKLATLTRIVHRAPDQDPASGFVAIGDVFPTLERAGGTGPATLPTLAAAAHILWLTVDCYLQWPQLEDMAWEQDHAAAGPGPTILYLTQKDEDPFDPYPFMSRFDADRLFTVEWADYHHSVPGLEIESNPVRSFEMSFMMRLPGADFPHDYFLDAQGVVTATSRSYRGRWPLGE